MLCFCDFKCVLCAFSWCINMKGVVHFHCIMCACFILFVCMINSWVENYWWRHAQRWNRSNYATLKVTKLAGALWQNLDVAALLPKYRSIFFQMKLIFFRPVFFNQFKWNMLERTRSWLNCCGPDRSLLIYFGPLKLNVIVGVDTGGKLFGRVDTSVIN